jgi:hypothetical protein
MGSTDRYDIATRVARARQVVYDFAFFAFREDACGFD